MNNQKRKKSTEVPKSLESNVANDGLIVDKQSHDIQQNNEKVVEKEERVEKAKAEGSQNLLNDEALDSELLKFLEESEKNSYQNHEPGTKNQDSIQQTNVCKNGVKETQVDCEQGVSQKNVLSEANKNVVIPIKSELKVVRQEPLDDSIEDDFQMIENNENSISIGGSGVHENDSSFPLIRPIVNFTEEMVNKHDLFNYSKQ